MASMQPDAVGAEHGTHIPGQPSWLYLKVLTLSKQIQMSETRRHDPALARACTWRALQQEPVCPAA